MNLLINPKLKEDEIRDPPVIARRVACKSYDYTSSGLWTQVTPNLIQLLLKHLHSDARIKI